MSDRNLYSLLDERFRAAGDNPAFRAPDRRILLNYRELHEEVARYANALTALGLAPGHRVSVQIEKSLANVILYLAVMKAGGVFQPLNTAYTENEVGYFVGDAEPSIIVCDPSRQEAMRLLADRHRVTAVVNLDAKGEGSLAQMARGMTDRHDTIERDGDDLAGLLYTSGTTGRSKGAMLTHDNLSSNALTLHRLWGFVQGDVLIHALPIFHVHGLYVALNTAFLNASEMVWFEKFDADATIAAFENASVMMGVPTFYTRLLTSPKLSKDACKAMRLFISGSAPLLAETHAEFEARTGHRILERYGMTETGMIASNPYKGERIAGTVGHALPDVSVRIADAQGLEVKRGEIGVIEVKGPNVFKGYWRMSEKTAEEFRADGSFITGDVATMTDDGRITIVGRAKDVIITGGFNVYPKEIEEEIDALPGIIESAVVGIPHADFGEGVIAVVTAKTSVDEKAIIATLSSRLARFKCPKRIIVIESLPRNAMGKVQKAELRKTYADLFRQA
jgi:malonyl-CoA/methylmalonyl-CoA synthetase